MDGIRRLAAELDQYAAVRLRVVGGPTSAGGKLAADFKCIEYKGALDNEALKSEAATWCAFVDPIFCQARGISTKVATALGWRPPVLTTLQGARGYQWDDSVIPRIQSVKELAHLACQVASEGSCKGWQMKASQIAKLAPSISESGKALEKFLNLLVS